MLGGMIIAIFSVPCVTGLVELFLKYWGLLTSDNDQVLRFWLSLILATVIVILLSAAVFNIVDQFQM